MNKKNIFNEKNNPYYKTINDIFEKYKYGDHPKMIVVYKGQSCGISTCVK
jgi:hypothetical protein